jgi:16S rRNA (cytosine967-C5)-methyltransferase
VKKKGIMFYSTCTILEIENAEVVQKFLQRHPEFEKITVP